MPVGGGCAAHLGAGLGQTRHLPSLQGLLLTAGWRVGGGGPWSQLEGVYGKLEV